MDITVLLFNNATYGMTGGQMAPTTLNQMVTTTTPYGRDPRLEGYPIRISEMVALTRGAVYIERTAVNSPAHIQRTKRAIRKAFLTQIDDLGFALVEVLSPCPTNWRVEPPRRASGSAKKCIRFSP
jgi:2-oxoglutarate ferredoxin oxidoreductase subunit beta